MLATTSVARLDIRASAIGLGELEALDELESLEALERIDARKH